MLLNMVMVSSVVLLVFAVIFITAYTGVQNENQTKLMVNSPGHAQIHLSSGVLIRNEHPEINEYWQNPATEDDLFHHEYRVSQGLISPGGGISFSVLIDPETNVLEVDSVLDMTLESFSFITQSAVNNARGNEIISVEGRTWQFMSSPVRVVTSAYLTATQETGITTNITYDEGYSYIRFVDVTDSHRMLRSLALTLSGALIAVLTIFFFISRFFAGQAVKPMEEAWEKQRRFITDASHELKTPLSVINANCGVLYANKEEPVDEQIKWVDSISRATDRMTGLIGSMLSLANIDDKQLKLQSISFNLSEEFFEVINEPEAVLLEKDICVTKTIQPDINIESDKEQVRKILTILTDNAVKYTPHGGEIIAGIKKEKHKIICTIRNSGEGISPEELPNIFDRFYRGDPARSSENTGYGLGLSIAKAISDQLGIKLTASAVQSEYTEFKLIFNE